MRHTTTKGLYQYWNTVRGERLAPRRFEIEPSEISPYLSETFILETPHSAACRFRVAGTKVCEVLGEDLRGQLFGELWSEADYAVLADNFRTISQYGAVGLFSFAGEFADAVPEAEFEMLLLPLTHLEERVERVLGSVAVTSTRLWLTTSYPHRLRLTSNQLIWPDGRPHGLMKPALPFQSDGERPVFRTGSSFRRARLVRNERRSFLVYDGGLTDDPIRK